MHNVSTYLSLKESH